MPKLTELVKLRTETPWLGLVIASGVDCLADKCFLTYFSQGRDFFFLSNLLQGFCRPAWGINEAQKRLSRLKLCFADEVSLLVCLT